MTKFVQIGNQAGFNPDHITDVYFEDDCVRVHLDSKAHLIITGKSLDLFLDWWRTVATVVEPEPVPEPSSPKYRITFENKQTGRTRVLEDEGSVQLHYNELQAGLSARIIARYYNTPPSGWVTPDDDQFWTDVIISTEGIR